MTLVLAIALCSLASCDIIGKKPEKLTAGADEVLLQNPYSVELRVKYSSDDEAMSNAINSFSNPVIKIQVDGENFKAAMGMSHGEDKSYASFTFVSGVLYTEYTENGTTVKDQRAYTDEDKAALRESLGAGAVVSYDDFEEVDVKSLGKVSVIKCDNIKADAIESLTASLEEALKTVFDSAEVAVYKATLAIEIEKDRYNVIILTCEYFITTPTDSYSVNMEYSMKFDYETAVEITAPAA